jgi:hypothetical protein
VHRNVHRVAVLSSALKPLSQLPPNQPSQYLARF